jgi:hypothetical protein
MNKPLDEALSNELATQIDSKARQPFKNAYSAVLVTDGAIYVQGFLVFAGKPYTPIEHGWIELDDRIIDPNLPHLNKTAQDLFYFPAHCLTAEQLKAAVEEAKEDYPEDDPLPVYGSAPYDYYGDVMLGGTDYSKAYQAAAEKSMQLNRSLAENN